MKREMAQGLIFIMMELKMINTIEINLNLLEILSEEKLFLNLYFRILG
tara:strand:+ start:107 stop:250 length:144 start_codon:yes stop_codon:yes gene_type:complete